MTKKNLVITARQGSAPVWKTRDGRVMQIADMDDRHLTNSIRMCIRNVESLRYQAIERIELYLCGDPPDGAYDCASQALVQVEAMSRLAVLMNTSEPFPHLCIEAQRRGLEVASEIRALINEHILEDMTEVMDPGEYRNDYDH
jgi:hypothetical protein